MLLSAVSVLDVAQRSSEVPEGLMNNPVLQGRWQHEEKVGYFYPSGLEKTLCKWEVYVPLVTKVLKEDDRRRVYENRVFRKIFVLKK
jgi:hypothetical protein